MLSAWIAVAGGVDLVPLLCLGVLVWVAGFDTIYACQDRAFDVRAGLHSILGGIHEYQCQYYRSEGVGYC